MRFISRMGCWAFFFLVGCGVEGRPEEFEGPDALFANLETRLLGAERVEIQFRVQAEGAVTADLGGSLQILPGGTTHLTATGVFAGISVDLFIHADSMEYEFGNESSQVSAHRPDGLNEALLIGLTRMGILHNLAMLTVAAPPDRVHGGIQDWATVTGFDRDLHGEGAQPSHSLFFSLTVDGVPSATVELDLDSDGMPTGRRQFVEFPEGEMRVLESYSSVVIHP